MSVSAIQINENQRGKEVITEKNNVKVETVRRKKKLVYLHTHTHKGWIFAPVLKLPALKCWV